MKALIGLVGAALVGAMLYTHIQASAEQHAAANRNMLINAVDDLWLQAAERGANPNRWPEVEFVDDLDANKLAITRCSYPQPTIVFNEPLIAKRRWTFEHWTVPHEMAHVLVCLDGNAQHWAEQHGEGWQEKVRLLLPHDEAEDILAEQAVVDSRGDDDGQ